MERVVKRYLMHNQGDFDDIKLNDFDELKQDLTLMKNEFINDIYKSKDDILKNVYLLSNSIKFIAEDILLNTFAANANCKSDSHEKYRNLINFNESLLNSSSIDDSNSNTATQNAPGSVRSPPGSTSESIIFNNEQSEINPGVAPSTTIRSSSESEQTPPNSDGKSKKKLEFIDNLLVPSKNSSPTSKVGFDMGENKFFPMSSSNNSLYKIVEETTQGSISRSEF